MDRTSAGGYVLDGIKRLFRDRDLAAGIRGTEHRAADRNAVQEELLALIEGASLAPSAANWTQVRQALSRLYGGGQTPIAGSAALTVEQAGLITVNAAAGAMTLTLPAANAMGGRPIRYVLARYDSNVALATIQCAGSDTLLNIGPSITMPRYGVLVLRSDGIASWVVCSRYVPGERKAPLVSRSGQGIILGAGYSGSVSVAFTAPVAGRVLANAALNLASQASASVAGNLTINGTLVAGDTTNLSQAHIGVAPVSAGDAVTVAFAVTTGTSPAVSATYMVGAQFVPD